MPNSCLDFASLIDPVQRAIFFSAYWEKKPLHVTRDDPDYYASVIAIADLEALISSPNARYPAVQLSKNGGYFPPEAYTQDVKFGADSFTGAVDADKVNAEYRGGATVVLPALHRMWTPLARVCGRIESELDHVLHANGYLTPGNSVGFSPHYDTHDVLVLQIAGVKHWRVYPPPIELPHRKQPFSPIGYTPPAAALLEVDMAPGDLLYLPRGFVHTTTTSSEPSAHVTIGIAIYTWLDLAGELLQAALREPRYRKALPPGFASPDVLPTIAVELKRVLDDLRHAASEEELVEMLRARVQAGKAVERDTFRWDISVILADTPLQAPLPDAYRIVPHGSKVAIEFQRRRFILPAQARPVIEAMRLRLTFKTMELPAVLDLDARLALVRLLHERGFLSKA